ncbi:MAG: large subunit ribosomal protein [Acidimicrobiaceae bacterium]|jgi:large subunit ribosomal protein L22|nr:large subunit ribosomal protein [Acidimicrobiaceae bacterium]
MTGPKRNEGATKVGERVGTKATARYLRGSPTKARVVLDLVRGLHVRDADVVLQFTDREAARAVRKVLASAVANAQNNEQQDPEELYVSACFADEGPTLRRFRPRARGRATRIRKRTCHITIIVSRMSDDELEKRRAKEASRTPATARRSRRVASSRRERVARSRQAAAAARGTQPVDHDHDHDHEHDDEGAPDIDDSTEVLEDDGPTDVADDDLGDALEGAPVEAPDAEPVTDAVTTDTVATDTVATDTVATDKDAGEDA